MGRKRKSGLERTIEVLSLLSWRITLTLAIACLVLLHGVSTIQVATPVGTAQLGGFIVVTSAVQFARIGQVVLPVVLGLAAFVSFMRTKRDRQNFQAVLESGARQALLDMPWHEFEGMAAEYFRQQGFDVKLLGGNGPDGGVDVELRKDGELSLVQCKQWRASKVGVDVVRQLYGVMAARGATQGYVVSSADFTPDAVGFSTGRNIQLLNGEQLVRRMRSSSTVQEADQPRRTVTYPPSCPLCKSSMVKRVARQGKHSGSTFWGCVGFPRCRGTRPV